MATALTAPSNSWWIKLNAATAPGTYAFIDVDANTGQVNALGTDAIKVGMLYKPRSGDPRRADRGAEHGGLRQRRRQCSAQPPIAGTGFPRMRTGATLYRRSSTTSRAKAPPVMLPMPAMARATATRSASMPPLQLVNWLATDPTGTGDPDILLLGDYNSYAMEDPITAIKNAGFTNLIETFIGADAYSYVFDGQWGYLDHALGSPSDRLAGDRRCRLPHQLG